MIQHAHALLELKDAGGAPSARLRFSGTATTPAPDRAGDILEPFGATFTNPIPLLWHHDRERPIGFATLHPATVAGITFDATIPDIEDPGPLRDRVLEAVQSVRAGFIRAVSVGYRVLDGGLTRLKSGAAHIRQYEICELSLVTVPANMHATIQAIKSLDAQYLAAPGRLPSGATEIPATPARIKGAHSMTVHEQITQFENTRAAKVARMGSIMATAQDATLDNTQREEYDGLSLDVKTIDADLVRFRDLEKLQTANATRVDGAPPPRTEAPFSVSVKSNVPPGITWVRSVKALLQANGDSYRAMEYAKQYRDGNVDLLIKAAVAPGSTTDPAWAGALVTVTNLTNEFIALSRAATIIGKVPFKKVPFNVSIPAQTAGGTYKWVGQGKPKPVTKMQLGSVQLGMAKASGIIVLTEELVRSSSPDAETIVRDEMVKGIAAFLDQQLTDPTVAEVANVSPASITNGASTAASTNDPAQDLAAIVGYFSGNQVGLTNLTILMSEVNAFNMGFGTNALGVRMFPGIGPAGGSTNGVTIVASNTVGDKIIGIAPEYVLFADDGGVSIDVSREASIQMNDAPVSPADPATTVWSSLWQDNLVGLRAERFINWKKSRPTAVYYLTGAVYSPGVVTP